MVFSILQSQSQIQSQNQSQIHQSCHHYYHYYHLYQNHPLSLTGKRIKLQKVAIKFDFLHL
tara:strand:- start:1 stop:183 length:183 start_codon:yes stop_codon:yes gene_type:complete